MLGVTHDQKRDTTCEKHGQMENHVALRDLFQCGRAETVEASVEKRDGRHDAHRLTICRDVSLEVLVHRHGRQQQLRATILGRRRSSNLTDQIEPSDQPSRLRHPLFRYEVFAGEVDASRGWICGNEFGYGKGDAVTSSSGNQPTPDG